MRAALAMAPAPAPAPAAATAQLDASAGAEALVWVMICLIWGTLALVQAVALCRAPCAALGGAPSGGAATWAGRGAVGAALGAAFWVQLRAARRGGAAEERLLTWRPPLHVQVAGLAAGACAAALFASAHWHLGTHPHTRALITRRVR
jgi:hypothetical protein